METRESLTCLSCQIDEAGYATLGLNYRVGDAGLTSEKIDTFSLEFSLKF